MPLSKMRVYELAKLLEMNNKDLLTLLEKVSVPVKSHMSTIDDDAIQLVEEEVEKSKKKKTSSGKSAPAKAEPEKKAPAPKEAPAETGPKAPIEFADFQKLDLRIGTILAAEQHPNADKLLRFDVDLGEEKPRQIVSGIAAHFKPEDLVGRKVVVVANLPPRKLRGLESQGMILTAEFDGGLSLLTADAPSGSSIA